VASESPVLVVDDDAVSRQVLGEVLVGAGFAAELVSGGAGPSPISKRIPRRARFCSIS
jgi:CheY-like chemotaxis protein